MNIDISIDVNEQLLVIVKKNEAICLGIEADINDFDSLADWTREVVSLNPIQTMGFDGALEAFCDSL